jgi:class 3 adenylate cyclase
LRYRFAALKLRWPWRWPTGGGFAARDDAEIVIDPTRQRLRRRQAWTRIGLPVIGVVVIVASLAGITWYSYDANRRDALALADEVIRAQELRITREVDAYLAPAPRALELLRGVLSDGAFLGLAQGASEAMGWQILYDNPHLALVSYAAPDGSFMMLKRETDGAIDTKTIDRRDGGRTTTWTRRDRQGNTVAIEHDAEDSYDPRSRVWYRGAVEAGDSVDWSRLYIFFTDQRPGITAAQALRDEAGAIRAVFGVDIALESLSAFLSRLTIGRSGRALIVDGDGQVIAHPDSTRTIRRVGDALEPVPLAELGDPAVTRAYNRFRIDGPGRRIIEWDGARYLTAASPIAAAGARGWIVLLVVPEAEFVGFVGLNNRSTVAMSVAVVLMVVLIAAILVRQGLRADRNARLVIEREESRAAQSEAFAALSANAALLDPAREDALRALTRVVARVVVARRVGIWRRIDDGDSVRLEDCRDREHDGHTAGVVVARADAQALFAALDEDDGAILAGDAAQDPRLAAFHERCLAPLGTRAVSIMPVRAGARWVGFLCLEDARAEGATVFARAVAGMLAVRYAAARRETPAVQAHEPVAGLEAGARRVGGPQPENVARRRTRLPDRAAVPGGDDGRIRSFDAVAVLALIATDPVALARTTPGERGVSAIVRLASAAARIADNHEVGYLRVCGDRLFLASGYDGVPASAAAERLALAALELRAEAAAIFAGLGHQAEFRMGLDCGPVLGAEIGTDEPELNLWGDAVRVADRLAETGLAGAIVVAQTAYACLRARFVFQARGHFYLAGSGEMPTYLLASHE